MKTYQDVMLRALLLPALLCPLWAAAAPAPDESEAALARQEQAQGEKKDEGGAGHRGASSGVVSL